MWRLCRTRRRRDHCLVMSDVIYAIYSLTCNQHYTCTTSTTFTTTHIWTSSPPSTATRPLCETTPSIPLPKPLPHALTPPQSSLPTSARPTTSFILRIRPWKAYPSLQNVLLSQRLHRLPLLLLSLLALFTNGSTIPLPSSLTFALTPPTPPLAYLELSVFQFRLLSSNVRSSLLSVFVPCCHRPAPVTVFLPGTLLHASLSTTLTRPPFQTHRIFKVCYGSLRTMASEGN